MNNYFGSFERNNGTAPCNDMRCFVDTARNQHRPLPYNKGAGGRQLCILRILQHIHFTIC